MRVPAHVRAHTHTFSYTSTSTHTPTYNKIWIQHAASHVFACIPVHMCGHAYVPVYALAQIPTHLSNGLACKPSRTFSESGGLQVQFLLGTSRLFLAAHVNAEAGTALASSSLSGGHTLQLMADKQ